MANTTWNPSDIAGVALSNGDLTVTANPNAGGVRGAHRQAAGKFYWEYTLTTNGSTWNFGAGVAGGESTLTYLSAGGNASPSITVDRGNGYVWINGAGTPTLGAIPTGSTVGIALDIDNRLVWFRIAPAGNWNGNASYNPATGVGGRVITQMPLNWYPFAGFSGVATGQNVVANFGDTAFSGTVPAGFTSGFPADPAPPNIAANTIGAVEQWSDGNPTALVTQLAIEQWSVGVIGVQAHVTQVAIEQWASLKVGGGTQTRAMILA